MVLRWRERRRDGDEGTTLIEMMVATLVFTIILSIITTVIVAMIKQQQKESAQANNLDASRKVIETLDHTVRYANAVTTPGTGTDGNYYVEWQSGNIGQQQTCTQWRYVTSGGKFQYRTWQPPLSGTGGVTATSWITEATGLSKVGTMPVFTTTPTSASDTKQQLNVAFTATSGPPTTSSVSQVSLTAINTTSAIAPTGSNAVCTQVGRP